MFSKGKPEPVTKPVETKPQALGVAEGCEVAHASERYWRCQCHHQRRWLHLVGIRTSVSTQGVYNCTRAAGDSSASSSESLVPTS